MIPKRTKGKNKTVKETFHTMKKKILTEKFDTNGLEKIFKNGYFEIVQYEKLKQEDLIDDFIDTVTEDLPHSTKVREPLTGIEIEPSITPDDFLYLKVIGKSYFGKIMQVKYKTDGKIYSMKTIKKSKLKNEKYIQHIQTERIILEEIRHPFVVKLKFAFQTKKKLYLITECLKNGDLLYYLNKNGCFKEDVAKFYFAQIVLLFEFLHSQGIIYRVLSPENILLGSDGYIKLFDFSVSKSGITQYTGCTNTFCGMPEYSSPEMISGTPYGQCVDIWCMGILLYEMIYGETPFKDENRDKLYKKIIFNSPDFTFNNITCNLDTVDLITRCLEKNSEKRITLQEIRTHKFFKGVNFCDIYQKKVPAPIIPVPQGENDFAYIDPIFTAENAEDSLANGFTPILKDHFSGYTFEEENEEL